jgi:hypothetical protein
MAVSSKWVGSTLVYYDDYDYRWVKAVGPDVREWELRFGTNFATGAEFTATAVSVGAGTSTPSQAVTAGDRLLMTNAANENDGLNIQVVGTPFQLTSGKPLYFGVKASISDATQSDFMVGLATKDTTIIAAHALSLVDDGFGFYKLDGGTAIVAFAEKAGVVSTVTAAAVATTTKRIYEMYWDGNGTITWYLDGVEVTSMSAGYPTVVLSPSIVLQNGEAVVKTGLVEWMRVIQLG